MSEFTTPPQNECKCECHRYHLVECGECLDVHYGNSKMTFTDSAKSDRVCSYFHRYGEKRLGDYYFEKIFGGMISGMIEFDAEKLKYLDYLFLYVKSEKVFKIIHQGILSFLDRNGKGDISRDYEKERKIKWRIK